MKKILKAYQLTDTTQYWELIEESFMNGQREQAKAYFTDMPKLYKKLFIKAIICKDFDSDYSFRSICSLIDLI